MRKLFLLIIVLLPFAGISQIQEPELSGICTRNDLKLEPYSKWFSPNYDAYKPNAAIISRLKQSPTKAYSISIFLGTWCGDSHREVPRFLKVLDEIDFPQSAIKIIALCGDDSVYKQSPTGEEQGLHIYRVPTFIISKNGKEVNRIVEYPVTSLERDLLAVFNAEEYTPNYQLYTYLTKWLDDGLLTDENVSYAGLANQIKYLAPSEGELNAFAFVLSRKGKAGLEASVKAFQIGTFLNPNSYRIYFNLAIILGELGQHKKAAKMMTRALELNKEPKNVELMLEKYDVVRDRVE